MAKIEEYKPGMIVYGQVTGIKPYGAFVSFENGITGLIHISEISNGYVKNIDSIIKLHSYVMSKIIDVDSDNKQLRLSYKALTQNKRGSAYLKFEGMPDSEKGFKSIVDHMVEWIDEYDYHL